MPGHIYGLSLVQPFGGTKHWWILAVSIQSAKSFILQHFVLPVETLLQISQ